MSQLAADPPSGGVGGGLTVSEVQQDPSEVVLLRKFVEYFSLFLIRRI